MFGRRKSIVPRTVEIAHDKGEFRPGLYDRDLHELKAALSTLDRKLDAVLDNQLRLDELIRKVGLVVERDAQMVEKVLATVDELEKTSAGLVKEVDALGQQMAGIKTGVKDAVKERLDELVNQLVASHQDVIGWLRRVTDKIDGRDNAGHELGDNEKALLNEHTKFSGTLEKKTFAQLRQVISMIVAGDTAKAVEVLSAIYNRLISASGSKEIPYKTESSEEVSGKRTAGLRTGWQDGKREPGRNEKPEEKLNSDSKDERDSQ